MDDKSPCFVVADRKDYISSALNDLTKQSNIEELSEDVNKERLIKEVEKEILKVVTTMTRNKEKKQKLESIFCRKLRNTKLLDSIVTGNTINMNPHKLNLQMLHLEVLFSAQGQQTKQSAIIWTFS